MRSRVRRHCGSRAGKARPDELSTTQALDLAAQMIDLGVKEVTLIGGEAYLREDWLEIVRRVRREGCTLQHHDGWSRGFTAEFTRGRAGGGCVEGISVSVDGLSRRRTIAPRVCGRQLRRGDGRARQRARAVRPSYSANTQINRWNWRELAALLEVLLALRHHRVATTAHRRDGPRRRRGRPAPRAVASPRALSGAGAPQDPLRRKRGVQLFWPGNNSIGVYGPYGSISCARRLSRGSPRRVRRWDQDARDRGQRRREGLSVAAVRRIRRRERARRATPCAIRQRAMRRDCFTRDQRVDGPHRLLSRLATTPTRCRAGWQLHGHRTFPLGRDRRQPILSPPGALNRFRRRASANVWCASRPRRGRPSITAVSR